jgi:hypothetical protein
MLELNQYFFPLRKIGQQKKIESENALDEVVSYGGWQRGCHYLELGDRRDSNWKEMLIWTDSITRFQHEFFCVSY